ncbi:hypothetical protein OUZ56_026928 [Daphnia magna]|uniref:Uncharacterized protein n=1 Tax=Daphnia magna TaxID=35525 RepID=A0ABQ9ZN81_9CRUS|nr:hypothetical protein OUZ56_026928 [Daphnia magna]
MYCSSCLVRNFTGLLCKLVSPLRSQTDSDHVSAVRDHVSVNENGSTFVTSNFPSQSSSSRGIRKVVDFWLEFLRRPMHESE